MKIERTQVVSQSYQITAVSGTTCVIPYATASGGLIGFVSSGAGTVSFFASHEPSGPWLEVAKSDGTPVTITAAQDIAVPIPDECFAAQYLKLLLDSGSALVVITTKS